MTADLENQTAQLKDGRVLGYAQYGDPQGKPLFFFHGWPGSRFRSKGIDNIAKRLHIRVVSVDRPGFGLSSYKDNRTLLDWPDDVCELADKLNIQKFSVMGISGGGPYVAACAYKISERIIKAGIVVGLSPTHFKGAFDGIAWTGRIGWENYARFPIFTEASSLIWFTITRYAPFLINSTFTFKANADRKLLSDQATRDLSKTFQESFKQGIKGPALDLKIYTKDWSFKLEDIRCEVYLWYGDADKNVSLNMGKYYQTHIRDSELIIYPNEGHLLLQTHTEEILETIV